MKKLVALYILTFGLMNCQNNPNDLADSTQVLNQNSTDLGNESNDPIKRIKENFSRINSISNWTKIDTKELEESSEGGEAKFYYQGNKLEKIVTKKYGEMFQTTTEYYLMDGQISFVYENSLLYNRPIYYDQIEMEANGDTEYFDIDKSKVVETRLYFDQNKIIQILSNQESELDVEEKELEKLTLNTFQNLLKIQN